MQNPNTLGSALRERRTTWHDHESRNSSMIRVLSHLPLSKVVLRELSYFNEFLTVGTPGPPSHGLKMKKEICLECKVKKKIKIPSQALFLGAICPPLFVGACLLFLHIH